MKQAEVRELVDRLLVAVLAKDARTAAAVFAPDGIYHEARHLAIHGRAGIEAHFAAFFEHATQWTFDVDAMIVEGPRAAVAYRFGKIEPNGSLNERYGCAIVETGVGCIRRWREYEG